MHDGPRFTTIIEDGARLNVVVSRTPRGVSVVAEETLDGRVVGRIEASQLALQRALGLAQRASQPEHGARDLAIRGSASVPDPFIV